MIIKQVVFVCLQKIDVSWVLQSFRFLFSLSSLNQSLSQLIYLSVCIVIAYVVSFSQLIGQFDAIFGRNLTCCVVKRSLEAVQEKRFGQGAIHSKVEDACVDEERAGSHHCSQPVS